MINRQKLIEELKESIKWIEDYCEVNEYHNGIVSGLKRAINHVTAEPPADQWIPCSSGKLPDVCELVLITDTLECVFQAQLLKNGGWDVGNLFILQSDYVTAWMPLPEPYKGVE